MALYWTSAPDIGDQPLLWELNHSYGTSGTVRVSHYILEFKHGYLKDTVTTGLDTVQDFQSLYESFEHGYLLATVRYIQTVSVSGHWRILSYVYVWTADYEVLDK